jgi:hypothetical protein
MRGSQEITITAQMESVLVDGISRPRLCEYPPTIKEGLRELVDPN